MRKQSAEMRGSISKKVRLEGDVELSIISIEMMVNWSGGDQATEWSSVKSEE